MARMTAFAKPSATAPLWTRARAMYARALAAIGDAASIAMRAALPKSLRRQIIAWLCPLEHVVRKLLLAEAAEIYRAAKACANGGPRLVHIPLRGMAHHVRALHFSSQREEGREEGRTAGRNMPSMRALHRPLPPPLGAGDASSFAPARSIDVGRPETWRATFSFALPRDPHRVPDSRAPRIRAPWGPTPPPAPGPERIARVIKAEDAPFCLARRFEALRRVLENPRPYAERLARLLARELRRFRQIVRRAVLAPCRSNGYDPDDPRLGIDAMGAGFVRSEIGFADSS